MPAMGRVMVVAVGNLGAAAVVVATIQTMLAQGMVRRRRFGQAGDPERGFG